MIRIDTRDWREYNEKLVRRGWFYLSTDFVKILVEKYDIRLISTPDEDIKKMMS